MAETVPAVTTVKLRSRSSAEKKRPSYLWLLAALILPLWSCMVRYRFTADSRLPSTGPFILAPNHYSEIDPIAMGAATWHLGRLPRFMAKASLFQLPLVGRLLRASGQIPVQRDRARQGEERGGNRRNLGARGRSTATSAAGPMDAATELIRREAGVIVYPEGTLTREPSLWPMRGKSGAVRLALETGIPLIPAAHWGTGDLMPRYGKGIQPFPRKTIHVAVGSPLDLSEYQARGERRHPDAPPTFDQKTVNEATAALMREITRLLAGLRGEEAPTELWDPAQHRQSETGRF